jgi:ferredoxin-NADP reductase
VRLVVSVRAPDELLYASELAGPETSVVYTRTTPDDSPRTAGRLTAEDLAPLVAPGQTAYVCGSAGFADAASHLVVDLGVPVHQVRVERFGPTT